MKSPIAPPRITRMLLNSKSVLTESAGQNRHAVNCGDAVDGSPARVTLRAPIDLIPQQVRHCDPKKAGNDQQVSEHGQEQASGFVAEEGRFKERFGREQTKNAECAHSEKFFDEPQYQHIANGEHDQQWLAKACELAH